MCFLNNDKKKKILRLTDEAELLWRNKRTEVEGKIAEGFEWDHIKDIAAKSGSNALRIAAILKYFSKDNTDAIGDKTMKCALHIVDWYLNQASHLFYPMSERYQFEQDVRELYSWIKNRIIQNNGYSFPKNDLEKYGPNRLRRTEKLTPVLE